MDAPVGAGGGKVVHICAGPIYVRNAKSADILEVRILDRYPRPCANLARFALLSLMYTVYNIFLGT
jgi:acetamidase/formamidase